MNVLYLLEPDHRRHTGFAISHRKTIGRNVLDLTFERTAIDEFNDHGTFGPETVNLCVHLGGVQEIFLLTVLPPGRPDKK